MVKMKTETIKNRRFIETESNLRISLVEKAYHQIVSFIESDELLVVVFLTLAIFFLKVFFLWQYPGGPYCFGDELLYKQNAEALFGSKNYAVPSYPPVYSLFLAPAFIVKNWYQVMLWINALLNSTLVPITWFLARTVSLRYPLVAAFLVAFSPIGVIYPFFILSENLFVPFFVLAAALALRGGTCGNAGSFIFGVVMGLAYLTKFLFLPAVPVFLGIWLKARFDKNKKNCNIPIIDNFGAILFVIIGYGSLIGIWIFYGLENGIYIGKLFRINYITSAIHMAKNGGVRDLLMWGTIYISYVCLAWAPFWGVSLLWITQIKNRKLHNLFNSTQLNLIILSLVLIVGYWLVATQHSFRAAYNYPEPQYLIGRYLVQVGPIILVSALLLLETFYDFQYKLNSKMTITCLGILLLVVFFSWNVLFNQAIWALPKKFTQGPVNAIDIFAFSSKWLIIAVIFITIWPVTIGFLNRNNIKLYLNIVFMLSVLICVANMQNVCSNYIGGHARKLAMIIPYLYEKSGKRVDVLLDSKYLPIAIVRSGLEFFDSSKVKYCVQEGSLGSILTRQRQDEPALLLTTNDYGATIYQSYSMKEKLFRIYYFYDGKCILDAYEFFYNFYFQFCK